jgi:hypothetical protein
LLFFKNNNMMINYIQFVASILLLTGYSSALPATSNDHKLDRRLLSPGMGLVNVDLSDLRILSPESNTFKLNYFAGVGNYHGPDVVYFDPFAQPGQEQPRSNMGPLAQAPSQPQPGQYINMQQAPNQQQGGQLPQIPNQVQGRQQVQQRSQFNNAESNEQPQASGQSQQQSQTPKQPQVVQQPQQQLQASNQPQSNQQTLPSNQVQPNQIQAPIQFQPSQHLPAPNQVQPNQNQARW